MKQPSSRALPTFVLAAFFLPLFAQTPKPASAPPTANNNGSDEPCGNPYYSWPVECPTCEDDNSSLLTFDIGSFCDISPMNAYTGSAQRSITDLSISGSVGNMPLEFKRYSSTRLSGRNLSHSSFGIESSWSHNFEWVMRDNGGTVTQPIIKLTYPDGREVQFRRPDATATVWNPTGKRIADRLIVNGDNLTLRTGDLKQFLFKRRIHSINGGVFYRIESFKDAESNTYTVSYDDNDDTLIRQVTDPANHWIKFHYNDLAVRSNASTVIGETLLPAGSTGVWKELAVTPGTAFRFLALHQGNTWRQKMPLRVAELEFYNQNNVKISGTAFGSWPWATSSEPFKATDGNINTQYQYAYEKVGYVGIDLGAGNASQVSRIRFRLAGTLNTDASVTFLGMNNEPTPNYVISHVEGSDGRQIGYDYSVYTEPSGIFQWAQLTAANYSDLTASAYTYKWQHRHVMPVLETADDPRDTNPVKKVRYSYDLNTVVGFVVDQYDDSSGQLLGSIRWDGAHIPKIVYPNGKIHRFEHTDGLLTRAINSYGATTDYTFDANGFVLTENDPNGRTTTYTRGGYGRVLSIKKPGGSLTTLTRDSVGYITARNENGKITTYTLDPTTKRRTRTDHPDGTYETWTYNTFGQKLSHRLRNGFSESWTYVAGLLHTHTDSLGAITTWNYYGDAGYPATNDNNIAVNIKGRIATIVDPHGNTTAFHYNDRGQITRQTETPGGNINRGTYPVQNTTNDFITTTLNTYDDYGNLLVRIINTNDPAAPSRRWIYEYDSLRRRTREQDPLDRVTTYSYNTNGTSCNCGSGDKPHQINHPDGTITRYAYDKEWRLLTTVRAYIDSSNNEIITITTSNTYDIAGQLFQSVDTLGRVTRYEYDNDGRVTKITRAFGSTTTAPAITTYQYDLDGNRTQVTNPVGTITSTTYDSMNRPRFVTAALGTSAQAITEYIYTGPRLTSIKDPLLRATGMEYDALDRVVKTTLPDGNYTQSFFDLLGRNYASRDLRGNIPRSTFNSQGQTIATTDAAGVTTTAIYNGQGDLIRTSLPSGKAVAYTHDTLGNVIKTTIAPGTTEESVISESLTRDAMLRPLTVKDGEGKITTYTYDTEGRTTRIKNPLNQATDYTYYADGQLHTTREADNLVASTRTYDDLGRLKTDKDGKNQIIEYFYDAAGRMTSYKDAKGSTFGFGYDPFGRRTSRTEPNGTGQAYSYDVLGRLLTHTKADGTVLTHNYQNPHRDFLTKITQGGTTLRTYSHFVDGQINTATNAHATISRSYDSAGRLIGETQSFTSGPSGGFSYDYDTDGNLEFHTRPDNTVVDYKYDLRNLLKKINTPENATVAEYTYNGRNQPLQTKVENGLFIATRAYDDAGRLLSVTNGTLDETKYTLTPDGRRATIKRNTDNETYNYDNARQVSTANYGGLSTIQNWTYDEAGNRITAVNNGVTTTYDPNSVNAYTSITGGGFLTPNPSYDPNGNTLHLPRPDGSGLTLGWNVHNELTSATNGAGDTATYQYDAFGRRTRRTETIGGVTTTTWFFTNGWNVELEHNGTAPTQRMTWGLDLSGSLQGAGGVGGLIMIEDLIGSSVLAYFPTYDGNGNITAWVDDTGTVVARQRYDAFGNIIQQTGTAPSNYAFSTKPIEKVTGLLYYGYRYYDPITGRWPSRDPIEERGGVNLYGFGYNGALSGFDVMGEWWIDGTKVPLKLDAATVMTDGKGGLTHYIGTGEKMDQPSECCFNCLVLHENSHIADILAQNPNIALDINGKPLQKDLVVLFTDYDEWADSEIKAHNVEKTCLIEAKKSAKGTCLKFIEKRILQMDEEIKTYEQIKVNFKTGRDAYNKKISDWENDKSLQHPGPPTGLNPQAYKSGVKAINAGPKLQK